MEIPKYVADMMARSEFDLWHPNGSPGYTIRVRKATPYTRHETLCEEVERLVAWANRMHPTPPEWESPTAFVVSTPGCTRYNDQYAVVTIFDPVMKNLEEYIPE